MSYWENRIAEKQYISYTQYSITHYFLPFITTKHINTKAHFMVRKKHDEFPSYKKIILQKNLISRDEISFTVHTKVMLSNCNTVKCYKSVKAQNNTNCQTKNKFKQYMIAPWGCGIESRQGHGCLCVVQYRQKTKPGKSGQRSTDKKKKKKKNPPPPAWMHASFWVLCFLRCKSLRRADPSFTGGKNLKKENHFEDP
jgi:hypothetical protein